MIFARRIVWPGGREFSIAVDAHVASEKRGFDCTLSVELLVLLEGAKKKRKGGRKKKKFRPRMQFLRALRKCCLLVCPACCLAQNGTLAWQRKWRGERRDELFRKLQRRRNYSSLLRIKLYGNREFPSAHSPRVKLVDCLKIKAGSCSGRIRER